ncbi:MAG TPA: hypothetical protein DCP90_04775 [Clostridiales bacterium]|nr:MAG: hypothetical protein A2Y22_06490 [Clostridiales bacterium GWD2_32_59]HAN09911.1 hypothetical protein [Clostridiales bacterium]
MASYEEIKKRESLILKYFFLDYTGTNVSHDFHNLGVLHKKFEGCTEKEQSILLSELSEQDTYLLKEYHSFSKLCKSASRIASSEKLRLTFDNLMNLGCSDTNIHDILKRFPTIISSGNKINRFSDYLRGKGFKEQDIFSIIRINPQISAYSEKTLDESFDSLLEYFSDAETKKIVTEFPNSLSGNKVRKDIKFQLLDLYDLKQQIVDRPKDLICGVKTVARRINFLSSYTIDLSDNNIQSDIFSRQTKFNQKFGISTEELSSHYSYVPNKLVSSIKETYNSDSSSSVEKIFETHYAIFDEILTLEKFTPVYANTPENNESCPTA